MIVTLLFIFLIILGIFVVWIVEEKTHLSYEAESIITAISGVTIFMSFFLLIISLIVIMFVQIPAQKDYEAMLYEKEVLEYRLENQDNVLNGNELLYQDITEFNNDLRNCKYWADNLWLNWFFNQKIATIDYIDLYA